MTRLCAIACSFLALSFFAITSAFANEENDRKINSFFYFTMLQLNVQAIVCRDYVSFDTTSIHQKLMQYWDTKDGVSIPRDIFDKTVKEIQARREKLTLAEKQSSCKEGLRNTIQNYAQMRDLLLYRKLDKGVPPPAIELESVGLQ